MALTGSSKSNETERLYDLVRKRWIKKTPEEVVRQTLLQLMIKKLGFPLALIAVEKELNQIPHLLRNRAALPDRRVDIICFAKGIHPRFPLFPLLLVECKEDRITQAAIEQVVGYNMFVEAPFIALADPTGAALLLPEGTLQKGLPSYEMLLKAVQQ